MSNHLRHLLPFAIMCLVFVACSTGSDVDREDSRSETNATSPPMTLPPVKLPSSSPPTVGAAAWDRSDVSPEAVRIEVGDDAQKLVDANPPGTAFLFASGLHSDVSIRRPKDGNGFFGEVGAILDGGGEVRFAIVAYDDVTVRDVVIRGLIVQNYAPPTQLAALGGLRGVGWNIEFNEVRESSAAAIQVGDRSVIRQNYIHHNRQIGLTAQGSNVLIEGNEIAYNNYLDEFDVAWEAGGTKFVKTTNLIVRNNYVHHNTGAGLWTDIDNTGTLYEDNVVFDNSGPGIIHEISYSAIIRNNRIERNAHGFYRGGILIANSSDVEVYGNTLIGNDGGIILIHDDRGSGSQGTYHTRNITVTDNYSAYTVKATGLYKNASGDTSNIEFDRNTYNASGEAFRFDTTSMTATEWRGIGQDPNGTWE